MGLIDDLGRWAARKDGDELLEERGVIVDRLARRMAEPVSRRRALALFGGTAAGLASGAFGDPPPAEADQECCDNYVVCGTGTTCCCPSDPIAAGAACCKPTETCYPEGWPAYPVGTSFQSECCAAICDKACCTTANRLCNSQGLCNECPEGKTPCGEWSCCDPATQTCANGTCVDTCPPGFSTCGSGTDTCCDNAVEDCVLGTCVAKCAAGTTRCGDECCGPGQVCHNDTCIDCPSEAAICGSSCCEAGTTCCDATKGLCCPPEKTCRQGYLSCVCPQGDCICGDHCCSTSQYCNQDSSDFVCASCPPGHVGCGTRCCPPGAVCAFGDQSGAGACHGVCQCPGGGEMCGDECCGPDEHCTSSGCAKCPTGQTPCESTCCAPPFVCTFGKCECPEGHHACGSGCCKDPEQELGRPKRPPKVIKVKHDTIPVTLGCAGDCSGTVYLQTAGPARPAVLAAVTKAHKPVVLGQAKYRVAHGRKQTTARIHLSHAGRRYLAKHHGKVRARFLVKSKGHRQGVLSRVFTLEGPKPKPKK